ncbi:MAG: MmgE/PrpD family protein [Candidatus Binatia bacterium]
MNEQTNSGTQLSRRLAEFTASLNLASVPAKVTDNAKIAILDCLGVAVLASSQEIGKSVIKFAQKNTAPGPCTIWGTAIMANMRDAAFLNGTLAHGLDYDDRNHASTYTLASTMAVAENGDASGAKALEAFIVGREVRATLDPLFSKRSSGIGPGAKGWHSNGILGPVASACVASKILGLGIEKIVAAIGLATGSCGALTRDGGTMAKPFRVGHAAATGVTCALLAEQGFTSDDSALEGRFGLLEALGPIPDTMLTALGKDLGRDFELERDIKIKPFASCTATHAGIEAMLRIVERQKINPADVELIETDLKPYPLVRQNPKRGFEGRFSMPYCLAHVLVHGRLQPKDFNDLRLEELWMAELIKRVRHRPDSPSVTIALKNGERVSEPIQPHSDLKGWAQAQDKFKESTEELLSEEQQSTIVETVKELEKSPSVTSLTRALQRDPA